MGSLDTLKKVLVISVAAACMSIIGIKSTNAASTEQLLEMIRQNTEQTVDLARYIATDMHALLNYFVQENSADGVEDQNNPNSVSEVFSWNNYLSKFQQIVNGTVNSRLYQNDSNVQRSLFAEQLGVSGDDFNSPLGGLIRARILSRIPNINDLAYGTAIGIAPVQANGVSTDPYGYIKTASGFFINHPIPDKTWKGKKDEIELYKRYFNTLTAVTSYDSYVLSQLKADAERNSQLFTLQNDMMRTVSSSQYLSQIGGQSTGKVWRQLLLFTTQLFVINVQMQTYMRQMLQAQVMTNTLLMVLNQQNEGQIIRRAKGLGPGYS